MNDKEKAANQEQTHANRCAFSVVTCMDFRFHDGALAKALKKAGYLKEDDKFDLLTCPGAAKAIANEEKWESCILSALRLAISAHQVETVYLISHTSCAAYGFSWGDFSHNEILVLCEELTFAKRKLISLLGPKVRVIRLIAKMRNEEITGFMNLEKM